MSEEEIIEYLNEKNIYNLGHEDKFDEIIEYEKVLKNLIDLYTKQKKEVEELKEELFVERKTHISKYTIKNKIKELDEEYSKTLEKDMPLEFHNINAQRHEAIKMVLEELLNE